MNAETERCTYLHLNIEMANLPVDLSVTLYMHSNLFIDSYDGAKITHNIINIMKFFFLFSRVQCTALTFHVACETDEARAWTKNEKQNQNKQRKKMNKVVHTHLSSRARTQTHIYPLNRQNSRKISVEIKIIDA